MKIGIFGGTFDPVHHGHLRPIEAAAASLELDRVIYVPNNRSPFKEAVIPADSHHRVAMLALALAGKPSFSLSLSELARGGRSYTVDTLRELSRLFPDDELTLLLGTDALAGFPRWKAPEEIVKYARLAAFVRDPMEPQAILGGPELVPFRNSILILDSVRVTISSSDLRRSLRRGESISGSLPVMVEEYIVKEGLYRGHPGVLPG